MDDFKPGDLVSLKSGGPPMTVQKVRDFIECLWFTGGEIHVAGFVNESLKKTEEVT